MGDANDISRGGLAPALVAQLLAEAARAHPDEACGLLLGAPGSGAITGILPAANIAADPARRFEIAPEVLISAHRAARAGGPAVLGHYHSHPVGPATPSAADRAEACGDGALWAIVGGGQVGMWRDTAGGFALCSAPTRG